MFIPATLVIISRNLHYCLREVNRGLGQFNKKASYFYVLQDQEVQQDICAVCECWFLHAVQRGSLVFLLIKWLKDKVAVTWIEIFCNKIRGLEAYKMLCLNKLLFIFPVAVMDLTLKMFFLLLFFFTDMAKNKIMLSSCRKGISHI